MNEVTINLKNTTSAMFPQNKKPEKQHPHFFSGDHENFSKVNTHAPKNHTIS
jgi:hypothetical protein